ncbi:DEAD/DEAH box helicase [Paracidobacterium acidisoli]|uniref:DEAD/DEAH box helicase n=1 Tax=Paracidobacterium acidisoli TaxID=2303751 RepID=A0A372IL29_9BACT|nr:DEAD/DEAH box helicase [Paracidobacterium acidisoli]MBT9332259.1 DEAD/DEAH box helicase [Paracidobacterium acidisoli]
MLPPSSAVADAVPESLRWAHPVVQEWFVRRFGTPTEPQEQGWPSILDGRPTLISAPTGSGKTLAAFLICIDRLIRKAIEGRLAPGTEVVYVSPLKALSNDVQKNLEAPLREIQELALERGYLCPQIRTAVRTGDTSQAERRAMLKQPPHILVTTPESLYILLTAEKSREHLRRVQTVIVDEIHAMADDKRGAHLTLTLERLDALVCGENRLTPAASLPAHPTAPLRIGLSATQNPIELVAQFLGGERGDAVRVVQAGQRRSLDLAIEVPADELGAVATMSIWENVYARLSELVEQHRSTLVFVNTRRMVERLAFHLGERLGQENVAAHHGSLSRGLRLEAERRLKSGEIRVLVATASLELGIDIGTVDLVCQINSPRAIAVAMQRVGRAGHWRGAIPKGRFFATTRDDLMEQAACIHAMRSGVLDRLEIPPRPFDVLMQQIVAACGAEPWEERALFDIFRRAHPYRELTWEEFDEALCLLTEGIESSRGRYGSYLLRDRVHGRIQARRGARSIAVQNGGAIPDTALFPVIMEPEGVQIATLDEHFAVDSSPGDVIQLGNTSWRIQRIESAGRVLVEDAHGQPPTLPFWFGEAPQRTRELSEFVSELRLEIERRTQNVLPGYISQSAEEVAETAAFLKERCSVDDSGAEQLIGYVAAGRAVLGAVPSVTTIVAERFFDEGGGMQLILHAPFGGRINKAWGLALRKRFCRGFNFELQAAATDNGLNISLAEQHSFPLSDVFHFLTTQTVTELLEQASLASPIFKTRWRWDASRSLQLLRFQKGKKVPPQVQRTRSEDLLASVFPQAAACFENIEGDIQIPDHPLVREVMKDVLGEAMDLEGLKGVLDAMHSGRIRCVAVDTTTPSVFAHELLNANPYAFLDDAGLEERRARAVNLRGVVPDNLLGEAGRLSPEAIAEVREAIWPDIRDEHELHDLLCSLTIVPAAIAADARARHWEMLFARLERQQRATTAHVNTLPCLVAAERTAWLRTLWPDAVFAQELPATSGEVPGADEILKRAIQGWMHLLGPVTSASLAGLLGIKAAEAWKQMLLLEMSGTILRGSFERAPSAGTVPDEEIEWCERRILQRIHKRTLGALRKQIEPVTPSVYMRFLLDWQHLGPQRQLTGEQGLLEALRGLEGFEAPAIEWEKSILPQRVAGYDPRWLDALCLTGVAGWGRLSPHPAFASIEGGGPRRVIPTGMAPITFFLREEALWMDLCLEERQTPEANLNACLSELANRVRSCLAERGAMFASDLARMLSASGEETSRALWELVAAGLVTADGFDSLRMLIDPRRKQAFTPPPRGRTAPRPSAGARHAAGRWSLLCDPQAASGEETKGQMAMRREAQMESACQMLLRRYGVVFRDVLAQETAAPRWRDLLGILRRLEARGVVRGGRFVSGFGGEQFALPEAVEALRAGRSRSLADMPPITLAAADPMNLMGSILPGERPLCIAGNTVTLPLAEHVTVTDTISHPVQPALLSQESSLA